MNEIVKIYKNSPIRIVEKDGEPWFVAKDVCNILEIKNSRDTLNKCLDEDERGVDIIYTPGGNQEMTIVSEAGLYSLILRSRKPEAKAFKRWVTHEVLPSIRKTGAYLSPGMSNEQVKALVATLEEEVYWRIQAENRRPFFYFPEKFSPPQTGEFFESQKEEHFHFSKNSPGETGTSFCLKKEFEHRENGRKEIRTSDLYS